MALLAWVLIAAVALLLLSLVICLAVARILGQIAADVNDLLDEEEWSAAPLTRALDVEQETDDAVPDVRRKRTA
jgi:hypothetical protein